MWISKGYVYELGPTGIVCVGKVCIGFEDVPYITWFE